jgi:hypothetical protein
MEVGFQIDDQEIRPRIHGTARTMTSASNPFEDRESVSYGGNNVVETASITDSSAQWSQPVRRRFGIRPDEPFRAFDAEGNLHMRLPTPSTSAKTSNMSAANTTSDDHSPTPASTNAPPVQVGRSGWPKAVGSTLS